MAIEINMVHYCHTRSINSSNAVAVVGLPKHCKFKRSFDCHWRNMYQILCKNLLKKQNAVRRKLKDTA